MQKPALLRPAFMLILLLHIHHIASSSLPLGIIQIHRYDFIEISYFCFIQVVKPILSFVLSALP